jgi:hypothetical protein
MKLKWLIMILIVVVFSGGRVAMAQEGHQHSTSQKSTEHNMDGMDMSDKNSDSHNMEGMNMGSDKNSDNQSMDMSGDHSKDNHDDMEGMDMGHEPVVEKPANLKVLGTYGAVNLSFIMIGVWNKRFRRKGDLNGNSK